MAKDKKVVVWSGFLGSIGSCSIILIKLHIRIFERLSGKYIAFVATLLLQKAAMND